jgi:hypothetical protein
MLKEQEFQYKKAQIGNFLKREIKRKFGRNARVSIRKRRKFMSDVTEKISRKFGKDVLCLVDFTKQGFVSLVSPTSTESTDKGQLIHSFTHPHIAYTTHCVDRFSSRTQTTDNCIITLDRYLDDALLTFGHHEEFLVCPAGVFAYSFEDERLIIKTYINYELLSPEQIKQFYGLDSLWNFPKDMVAENIFESDIILSDEEPLPSANLD